ncbi:MAG: DUF4349 domain-containing protein [Tissierellia bacterium]|nr:DUF4349 domain-containing protein [Tissierellia bacterium]
MNKNVKDALTDIRDQIVEEDLEREKSSKKLGFFSQKRILSNVEKNEGQERSKKARKISPKILVAWAASLVLILLIAEFSNINLAYLFNARSENPNMMDEQKSEEASSPNDYNPEGAELGMGDDDSDKKKNDGSLGNIAEINQKANEKIIYHFNYQLQTLDFDKSNDQLMTLIRSSSSYIEEAEINLDQALKNANILVRVPKDKAKNFQENLGKLATVTSQYITSTNMTKEYRDLEADKLTQDIKEKKLQELLSKAESFDDIMKIEGELAIIASKKAQLEKKMADIDHDVDYHFFSITIREVKKVDDPVGKKITFLDRLEKQFQASLVSFVNFLENTLILLVRNWILILVILALGVFVYKKFRRP